MTRAQRRLLKETNEVLKDLPYKKSVMRTGPPPKWRVPTDKINPSHYRSHPSGVECIQIVEHMTFNCGQVVRYLWRAGLKDSEPKLDDLRKAEWYIKREIERLSK